MLGVRVQITAYVRDDNPGWVECRLTDASGQVRAFVEKVPVVSAESLDTESEYPRLGFIACEVIGRGDGKALIDTERPWGIESIDGRMRFEVWADLLADSRESLSAATLDCT